MTKEYSSSVKHIPRRIQLALPAKITGIVFWGMVLVGLLLAFIILQVKEKDLAYEYEVNSILFAYDIENILEHREEVKDLGSSFEEMFLHAKDKFRIEAISFDYDGKRYQFGEFNSSQERISHQFRIHDASENETYQLVELFVYMPSLKLALSDLRKKILLYIGSMVFIFGLVLQQILQKVLSRPFLNMVDTAESFAEGDSDIRFNEQRLDEFGYLAKFINRALDSIMHQQHELENSRKALFAEKERAEVTLHSIIDGVITTSESGRIKYMNPVAERLTGWSNGKAYEVPLNKVIKFVHEESGKRISNPLVKCLAENSVENLISHAALIRSDGETVPIEASAAPMRNDEGEIIGAVMVLQDVSQARRLTKQLSYQASHDALTGLYNRRMFEEYLQAALLNVQEEDRHHALCYIDLDQFKVVNDTCGHMAGDELLRQLAVLLHGCIREVDTLARLGGDEFGVLLENCPISQASIVADKIRQTVKDFRFVWQDKSFEIGASIGVVNINADNVDMASIMSAADVACYTAKDMGRNRIHIYEPTDAALAERHGQMHWATRIVDALENNQLVLFRQPEIALDPDYQTEHYEILVRIRDDDVLISPDSFIPAAERYNLMSKIDRWVIRTVFKYMSHGCCQGHGRSVTSINLSGTSLADESLLEFIKSKQQAYGINLEDICFEITETAAISNLVRATQFMKELKKEGCQFALDDFGSGLSSFAYLKNLPVDYIKIDGGFVVDMVSDPIDRAMVEAIISVGHVMQIKTIAEWVENEATLEILRDIGVDFVQGYHVGRPEEVTSADMDSHMVST